MNENEFAKRWSEDRHGKDLYHIRLTLIWQLMFYTIVLLNTKHSLPNVSTVHTYMHTHTPVPKP